MCSYWRSRLSLQAFGMAGIPPVRRHIVDRRWARDRHDHRPRGYGRLARASAPRSDARLVLRADQAATRAGLHSIEPSTSDWWSSFRQLTEDGPIPGPQPPVAPIAGPAWERVGSRRSERHAFVPTADTAANPAAESICSPIRTLPERTNRQTRHQRLVR